MTCYRTFVVPSKVQRGKTEKAKKLEEQSCENNVQNSEEDIVPTRIMKSTIRSSKPAQSTVVFSKVCLVCNQASKRIKGKEQEMSSAESKNLQQNIRKYIEWKDDQILSTRLSNIVFLEKEIKYHRIFRVKYQTIAEAKIKYKKRKQVK